MCVFSKGAKKVLFLKPPPFLLLFRTFSFTGIVGLVFLVGIERCLVFFAYMWGEGGVSVFLLL